MIRLLADDLTGALDTAAELVGVGGPVQVFWHGAVPTVLPADAAVDSGARELDTRAAVEVVAALTPALVGARLPYKKIDSLMRGPTLAEAAACFRAGGWERAVLAPAFPYQGRVTRDRVQYARGVDGRWSAVGGDIVAGLLALGVRAQVGQIGAALQPGISVFDAETDEDLRLVVAGTPAGVLWMGTGGLAQALGGGAAGGVGVKGPVLGLFGSDQAVTAGQLAACGQHWVRLRDGGPAEAMRLSALLAANGRALASLELPPCLGRDEAARRIGAELGRLVQGLDRPGTLIVAGGETLRGLCIALGAESLEVRGRIVPGLPHSVLRGGAWDGVVVVSKSGAFGHPGLLRDLILETERTV